MSSGRQHCVWTAFGLMATAVAGVGVFRAWHGYTGRAFAITLCAVAFFLAMWGLVVA